MTIFKIIQSYLGRTEDVYDVQNEAQLREILGRVMKLHEVQLDIKTESEDRIIILVEKQYSFLEFTQASGDPPYLSPLRKVPENYDDEPENQYQLALFDFPPERPVTKPKPPTSITFIVGCEPIQIGYERCLPVADMVKIIVYYFLYRELSPEFEWRSAGA